MATQRKLFGSIRTRLLGGSLLLSVVPLLLIALLIGLIASRLSNQALEDRVLAQLTSIRSIKADEVRTYIEALSGATRTLATSGEVRASIERLARAANQLPVALGIPRDALLTGVGRYYREDYQQEFRSRNSGRSSSLAEKLPGYPDLALAMQYIYIAENPAPLGAKQQMRSSVIDRSPYAKLHAEMQDQIAPWVQQYGFYDIFLVDMEGVIVYSYFKELDFGTNLRTGPFASTGIGEAFQQAAKAADPQGVYLTDFAPYEPSYDDQAAFFATPLIERGRRIGVLITQMPIDRINAVVNFSNDWSIAGLGDTGEALLIGPDQRHRAASRFVLEDPESYTARLARAGFEQSLVGEVAARATTIRLIEDRSAAARRAIAGVTGVTLDPDYMGNPTVVAYQPLDVLNRRFGLILKQDSDEAFAPVRALNRQTFIASALSLFALSVVAIFIALRLARSINRPIGRFLGTVQRVGAGDVELRVGLAPTDEIGELASAFDSMLDDRVALQREIEGENRQLNDSIINILTSVASLANKDFTVMIPVAEDVTGAVADAINLTTRETSRALGSVRSVSLIVSNASAGVGQRAQQVMEMANAASEEAMSASQEIQQTAMALRSMGVDARRADEQATQAIEATDTAIKVVESAVGGILASREQIRETEKRVKRLAERSQEINAVVGIVGQIAERTSMLALNASMQAVSAGEAGRGFAVVADEVKRLAESARDATQQIAGMVHAIQADTAEALQTMNRTIAEVVEVSRQAEQSGLEMARTRSATIGLVSAVRAISEAIAQQERASARLLDRAYGLLQTSQKTLEELQFQKQDVGLLVDSSETLVATVRQFKLPEKAG